eukprot:gnl/TRDRNA2_/TRDRNA2_186344_c0_seq1.p1 gnl/TRDRNA2_/TRDRNA2_186344_c0~~gnl/TRDRNA2_/TRDRNA2_186344_c0_seq1.p1  ORF type:complete len:443 (+),score=67.53 gnl/TRDRNA2_/TRDRNA2_186344_c0_seq1:107-1435(+)
MCPVLAATRILQLAIVVQSCAMETRTSAVVTSVSNYDGPSRHRRRRRRKPSRREIFSGQEEASGDDSNLEAELNARLARLAEAATTPEPRQSMQMKDSKLKDAGRVESLDDADWGRFMRMNGDPRDHWVFNGEWRPEVDAWRQHHVDEREPQLEPNFDPCSMPNCANYLEMSMATHGMMCKQCIKQMVHEWRESLKPGWVYSTTTLTTTLRVGWDDAPIFDLDDPIFDDPEWMGKEEREEYEQELYAERAKEELRQEKLRKREEAKRLRAAGKPVTRATTTTLFGQEFLVKKRGPPKQKFYLEDAIEAYQAKLANGTADENATERDPDDLDHLLPFKLPYVEQVFGPIHWKYKKRPKKKGKGSQVHLEGEEHPYDERMKENRREKFEKLPKVKAWFDKDIEQPTVVKLYIAAMMGLCAGAILSITYIRRVARVQSLCRIEGL